VAAPLIAPNADQSDSEEERKQDILEGKKPAEASGPTKDDMLEKSFVLMKESAVAHAARLKDAVDVPLLLRLLDTALAHVEHSPWKVCGRDRSKTLTLLDTTGST
jgi:hypothetical protein